MARPPTATDTQILDAAARVLSESGADGFTLAAVARAVGITRAAITFRFENAQNLRLRAVERNVAVFEERMGNITVERGGNGLLAIATRIGAMPRSPQNLLSFIQLSHSHFADDELRQLEERRGEAMFAAIDQAMPLDIADRAGAMATFAAHLTGSLIAWSVSGEADGGAFLRDRTITWLNLVGIACDPQAAAPSPTMAA